MARKLVAMVGLMALAVPVLAQQPYPYQDEQGAAWGDRPAEPAPDAYGQYAEPPPPGAEADLAPPAASVSWQTFYAGLAPYGQWLVVPAYGRVWQPAAVARGWRPYFYGRWEWTDQGWLWVSDEPWGWAAYHYGRWAFDPSYGWLWIPGYQWAPAWVTWRYSDDYIGWAPLGPGVSLYATSYPAVYGWWTFVPCRRFAGVPVHSVAFTGSHVRGIYHATWPAPPRAAMAGNHAPAWGGPARPFVEGRVGHAIAPVHVQPVPSPSAMHGMARAGVVPIYRPEIRPVPRGGGAPPARPPPEHSTAVAPVPGNPRPAPAPTAVPRGNMNGHEGPQHGTPAPPTAERGPMLAPPSVRPWGEPSRGTGRTGTPQSSSPTSPSQPAPSSTTRQVPFDNRGHPVMAAPPQSAQRSVPAPAPSRAGSTARPQGGAAPPHAQGAAPQPQGGGQPAQRGGAGGGGGGGGGGVLPPPHAR